jgi:hypothetical protein
MARTRAFLYKNRSFEVRASAEPEGWAVRLFEGGRRVSPMVYKISYEDDPNAKMRDHPGDFVEHLMVLMQSDVESGRLRLTLKTS